MVSHAVQKQSMAGEQKQLLCHIIVSRILFAMILFHTSFAMNWFAFFLKD